MAKPEASGAVTIGISGGMPPGSRKPVAAGCLTIHPKVTKWLTLCGSSNAGTARFATCFRGGSGHSNTQERRRAISCIMGALYFTIDAIIIVYIAQFEAKQRERYALPQSQLLSSHPRSQRPFLFFVPQAATAAAAVAVQTGVGITMSPDEAEAAGGAAGGLPASGYFVQHAVFRVGFRSNFGSTTTAVKLCALLLYNIGVTKQCRCNG